MHIPKRIIELAKDQALQSFSALAEQTVVEADAQATRAMSGASGAALAELNSVRAFLRGEAQSLRARMERHFASLLERSMLTMHAHKQMAAAQDIDYANLTLIDDDVVTRQIDIERMVGRLREAEQVELGRVNLTIAVMHNDSDARERENPFRPYLLARALYEGLRELMWDEAQSKLLYAALGQAMAYRLPGFYAGILGVFEAGGITARLAARPTAMSNAERERLAWQRAAQSLTLQQAEHGFGGPGGLAPPIPRPAGGGAELALHERLLPKLRRLKELQLGDADTTAATRHRDLLDYVWEIFHKQKTARVPPAAPLAPPAASGDGERGLLDQTLLGLQQEIAGGVPAPAPLALRDMLDPAEVGPGQRRVMDVVALIFESIVHDEMIGAPMQRQMGRLYLPFVRAALRYPELLHEARHPARRLLDRLGSVGAGITPASPCHAGVEPEVHAIVGSVLDLFDDDLRLFGDAERALDTHMSHLLAGCDEAMTGSIEAIAEAEADSARLAGAGRALSAALQPLQIDPRLADFILGTWARVLSHPGSGADGAIGLLPELLWSAQEKTTPDDRGAMMRMLPDLVRRVRDGMASIALPEAPSKAAFDRLVAVHMDVLGNKQERARQLMSLDEFRAHFAGFAIDEIVPAPGAEHWVGKFELEGALKRRAVSATVHAKAAARMARKADADWLSWARPGTGFELKVEGIYKPALLCAVSVGEGAFVLNVADEERRVIFLRAPLLEAMELGTLRPLEPAPLFDRAVESLMAGAQSLSV